MTALQVALVSLGVGLLLGYIGQRSRLCFMGAFRDLFLVRDWRGVGGVAAFMVTAGITFAVGSWVGSPAITHYPGFMAELGLSEEAQVTSAQPAGEGRTVNMVEDFCGWEETYTMVITDDPFTVEDVLGTGDSTPTPAPAETKAAFPFRAVGYTLLGAVGLGLSSNLAGGCPFRQHVLAGQGEISAWWYLLGFYVAPVVFTAWVLPILP
jgi:uncharacterized membrane protein YedE/YeeE